VSATENCNAHISSLDTRQVGGANSESEEHSVTYHQGNHGM